MRIHYLLFACLLIVAAGCRKGELPASIYYGKVGFIMGGLPGSSPVDVYLNGKKSGLISPGTGNPDLLTAAGKVKLHLVKAGTDSLVADSNITVPANGRVQLKILNSSVFGHGFVNSRPVAADSVSIQFFSTLGGTDFPNTTLKLDLFVVDINSGDIVPLGIPGLVLQQNKLNPAIITLPFGDAGGNQFIYAGLLSDPKTGETVVTPDGSTYFIIVPDAPGTFFIGRLFEQGGGITVDFTAL